jgi:hypothetical protein
VCPHCIYPFSQQQSFENHLPDCSRHVYQVAKYPSSESNEHIVKWRAREKTERVPFVIYADFESCLVPVDGDTDVLVEHIPSGFCAYTVSWDEEHETNPIVYSGPDCMDVFYDHLTTEQWRIVSILKNKYEMELLNENVREHFDRATECPRCFQPFSGDRKKVMHHNHRAGKFIDALCNSCNLQIQNRLFIPVVFRNLKITTSITC